MKKLFSSNSIEILAKELQNQILENSSFFSTNYIVVPNKEVKDWLMQFFAKNPSIKVVMNLSFYNVNRIVDLFQNISRSSFEGHFFDYLELNLYIEQQIIKIIDRKNKWSDQEKEIFQPLLNFLEYKEQFSIKSRRRLSTLCDELTTLFLKYGIYSTEILNDIEPSNWQEYLWDRIFIKDKQLCPLRDLKNKNLTVKDSNFHFFALSNLPPIFFDLSMKLKKLHHYILSPCLHFWEDICSDRERKSIQKVWKKKKISKSTKEELEIYLKDRNPILANMGRLLRRYLKEIENYEDLEIYENYLNEEVDYLAWENGKVANEYSLLKSLQLDLLFMRNPEKTDPLSLPKKDNSIKLHVANSKLREIQILQDNILSIVEMGGLSLSDIYVLAPNIKEYEPYIHMIFAERENHLKYKIADIDLSTQSLLIQGIFDLLFLATSKWERKNVKTLFENPCFQKMHRLSKEDVSDIFEWFDKANISWGLDAKHRLEKLDAKTDISIDDLEIKTWDYSIRRILFGFTFMMNQKDIMEEFNYEHPIEGLDLSQTDIFNKFLKAFNHLKVKLKIIEEDQQLTLLDWRAYLLDLFETNFDLQDSTSVEQNAKHQFILFLERIKEIGAYNKEAKFSFDTIFKHFREGLYHKKTSFNPNDVGALHFCSISKAAILPKKITYLIGMNDDYPKSEYKNSLSLYSLGDLPSVVEKQRMNFLEMLITTKEKLYISFISENENYFPSILVQELLSYLDRAYSIENNKVSEEILTIHPAFAFNKKYFSKGNVNSYSITNYLAAKSHYKEKKEKKIEIISREEKENDIEKIEIKELINFAKHPIKYYFNKVLDIYFDRDDKDEFKTSFLDRYLIREASYKMPVDEMITSYQKQGKFPPGIFNEIEKKEILKEIKSLHNNLEKFDVSKEEIYKIEFSTRCNKFEKRDDRNFIVPALSLKIKNLNIKIVGTLSNVTNKGLMSYSDNKLNNILRIWPQYLLYSTLPTEFEKKILFLKDAKEKSLTFNNLEHFLKLYVEYFIYSKTDISPLVNEWSSALIKKDKSLLEKKTNFNMGFEDLYFKWATSNTDQIFERRDFHTWSEYIRTIFSPLVEEK